VLRLNRDPAQAELGRGTPDGGPLWFPTLAAARMGQPWLVRVVGFPPSLRRGWGNHGWSELVASHPRHGGGWGTEHFGFTKVGFGAACDEGAKRAEGCSLEIDWNLRGHGGAKSRIGEGSGEWFLQGAKSRYGGRW
jgi:hypothetical protein